MKKQIILFLALLFALPVMADERSDREKLRGNPWEYDQGPEYDSEILQHLMSLPNYRTLGRKVMGAFGEREQEQGPESERRNGEEGPGEDARPHEMPREQGVAREDAHPQRPAAPPGQLDQDREGGEGIEGQGRAVEPRAALGLRRGRGRVGSVHGSALGGPAGLRLELGDDDAA